MYLSPEFALCFLAFLVAYWSLAGSLRLQNAALLAFSFLFYGALEPLMAVYLGAFALTAHGFARRIRGSEKFRRLWLTLGLLSVGGYLCTLKYYGPLRDALAPLLPGLSGWQAQLLTLDILVPAGVSFYTFQAVALLVACYRDAPVCRRLTLMETTLYLAFFPTVLAGPICRPEKFLPRLRWSRRFLPPAPALGLICRGLFKKLVVAHWLASTWVDPMFANPSAYNGVELAVGAMAYSLQIYADFSGLTDLVRGIAWLLGFRLPINFRLPYAAGSPREFWQRWHISLSTWIRDFIYIPLGGSRHGFGRTQINLLLAMLISGLWHGAGWNYLVWGGLHGLACILANFWPRRLTPPGFFRIGLTFVFVTFAWIFFRAPDLTEALDFLVAMGDFSSPFTYNVVGGLSLLGAFFLLQYQLDRHPLRLKILPAWPFPLVWPLQLAASTAFAYLCIQLGPSGVPSFIYFKY